ncbi:MAG: NADH:flavin oxidoreductase, partial [Armatimonadetes bacterium]|nr:NADH:flavin oxidoreductase [Armatimonadota bacterium]
MDRHTRLFSPLELGPPTLRNRIVLPPMVTCMEPGGDQSVAWYRARARGGAGLIILEGTPIRKLADPAFTERLRRTVDAVHEEGAAIAIQIFARGQNSAGEAIWASETENAREATEAELLEIIDLYAKAAAECRRVGFDGVQPHGAHGFFLNQFFSPKHNRRTDAFGGSPRKRMEMGLRVASAVREGIDEDCVLLYRHTPVGEGYGVEESREFARELEAIGVNVLDVSPSTGSSELPRAHWAGDLKEVVDIPVIAVGGFDDPDAAEHVLEAGRADLIAIGRGLIADADLPNKVRDGRRDEIIACILCNEKCYGNLARGEAIGCTQNEASGEEYVAEVSGLMSEVSASAADGEGGHRCRRGCQRSQE